MSKFHKIYLSWRKGTSHSRHLVGVIKRNKLNGITFQYLPHDKLVKAKMDGFTTYTEFPDLEKTYTENVTEIFKQRLFRSERSDYKEFLDFWGISNDKKDDTLYLLANTIGIVPTDNFEFLADYYLTKDLHFISEISRLSYTKISGTSIREGEELLWKKASSIHDKYQVDLFTKSGLLLGSVKKVHSKVFYKKRSKNLKVKIKALDKNGIIKRAFIEIRSS